MLPLPKKAFPPLAALSTQKVAALRHPGCVRVNSVQIPTALGGIDLQLAARTSR
jgi:hypothetical protein